MRTPVLPAVLLVVLAATTLTGCTGGPEGPSPSATATASSGPSGTPTGSPSPSAPPSPSASAPADGGTAPAPAPEPAPGAVTEAPEPVPEASAAGWTDDSAYEACVEHATETLGAGYTWGVRAGQTMVYQGGDRTIDVAGIYTGGDVGVAHVVHRCVLGGSPSAPELTGGLVR